MFMWMAGAISAVMCVMPKSGERKSQAAAGLFHDLERQYEYRSGYAGAGCAYSDHLTYHLYYLLL